jgi:hypothetical protein
MRMPIAMRTAKRLTMTMTTSFSAAGAAGHGQLRTSPHPPRIASHRVTVHCRALLARADWTCTVLLCAARVCVCVRVRACACGAVRCTCSGSRTSTVRTPRTVRALRWWAKTPQRNGPALAQWARALPRSTKRCCTVWSSLWPAPPSRTRDSCGARAAVAGHSHLAFATQRQCKHQNARAIHEIRRYHCRRQSRSVAPHRSAHFSVGSASACALIDESPLSVSLSVAVPCAVRCVPCAVRCAVDRFDVRADRRQTRRRC